MHSAVRRAIADTGAQVNVVDVDTIRGMGLNAGSLIPTRTKIKGVAAGSKLDLLGVVFLDVRAVGPPQVEATVPQMFYVALNTKSVYISHQCMVDIGVISPEFPRPGEAFQPDKVAAVVAETQETLVPTEECTYEGIGHCSCPIRKLPPTEPVQLPCALTEENIPQLEQLIKQRYRASAFNTCTRQKIPTLSGSPPLELHVGPEIQPVACHKPAVVPLHWQEAVREGLERDVRLGVLEQVPLNTPVRWQSRMVCTPKHDGSPRRTVDYNVVNTHCPRQTHFTPTPWHVACSIPGGVFKSVLDNWNGYHSVPLASEADKDVTTFITPWGRFRYTVAPMGLKPSGDGFTDRMDRIYKDTPRMKRIVDDALLFDKTVAEQFHRVCAALELGSNHGAIFNPKKFQFCRREVEYAGLMISDSGVRPPAEMFKCIREFPTPKNITDVRAWFGMVAQVSFAFSELPVMAPFRHLLSSKTPFAWSSELEEAFQQSKRRIIGECVHGVRNFDPQLPTCLATDWSKTGIGFWLCQKHCQCTADQPGCCRDGWQTAYMGSRFCTPTEQRYAPIEGEAMAAAWAANKCRYYLLGMKEWLLAVDHKPLIPILSTKELLAIPNPRLANQRVKLLPFNFKPVHIAGKTNVVPDTLSRAEPVGQPVITAVQIPVQDVLGVRAEYADTYGPPEWVARPAGHGDHDNGDTEAFIKGIGMAQIAATQVMEVATLHGVGGVRAVTWDLVRQESAQSQECQELRQLISKGMPEESEKWPVEVKEFFPYRSGLLEVDGIILFGERILIPASLRPQILDILHAGHSGRSTMQAAAVEACFWPGMTQAITDTRLRCRECTIRSPSQPAMPPHRPTQPEYPFSHICADFFEADGSYMALCDRYSGWISVYKFKQDSSKSIIEALHQHFAQFGIAKEFATDGQRSLCSMEVENFLARWGVRHRISSAYHPRSNKRAEVAVKQAKRLVLGNLGTKGEINTERLSRALLEHRNTPDPETGLSPAQVVFGRQMRGFLPRGDASLQVREDWRLSADRRAAAFAKRESQMQDRLQAGSKVLEQLEVGQEVVVQDPPANGKAGKWTKSGTVVEVLPHDAYFVRIHGSRTLTRRNRSHIKKIIPFCPEERIIPAASPEVEAVPEETIVERADKFVVTQPQRQWSRLSPEPHRHAPRGKPGENIISKLKQEEKQ